MLLTGGQAIVQILKQEGVNCIFGVPGESFTPFLDALYDEPSIQLITTRQEGGAAYMAEAYAKASGKVAVVMGARAVGAANLSIGVHTAKEDSTPMVVLLGQIKDRFRGREGFQEVDLDRFFRDICKWSIEIHDVKRIPEFVQRAFRIAKSGRPGPVVISLPEDVLAAEADLKLGPVLSPSRPRPAQDDIEQFYRILSQAQRPLILAGAGVRLSNAEDKLQQFAEKYNIPVMAAWRRHDVFSNNHPLYMGHLQMGTLPVVLDTFKQADTIIALGTRFNEVTTQGYSLVTDQQKIVHIDIEYTMLGKVYVPDLGIVADVSEALASLLEYTAEAPIHISKQWVEERRKNYQDYTAIYEEKNQEKVDNRQIIRVLQKNLPANAILVNDAGNFGGWLHSFYRFNEKKTYLGTTSGAMGYAMPAAIGAKLAQRDRMVVSLSGDGGFMMTVQELETAVRYKLPIISLIFNNNMYGSIRMWQERENPYRVIGTELGNPDFKKLAESFGAFGAKVAADSEFEPTLMAAIESGKPAVIEILCDPEQISVQQTITSLRNRAKKIQG